ncbi:MAG: hypothetical protein M1818_003374 [Claussenomyces sp. TS43310]|nr:MAG: hypothetical protein M1818_003374 [Claussenomyces sp. TS43310]
MVFAIPKDSIVLVTGINGYIGSHIADQLLEAGYKVRGTARTLAKADGVRRALEKKHGSGKVETVAVGQMSEDGAFDEAVKGVSGIAHVASNVSFDENPNTVIPEVISGVRSILESAAKEPSVKRFVYTSSSTAATAPKPNKKFIITKDTWNNEAIEAAWKPPPYERARAWDVYGASKTQGEQELWKFVAEKKPHFVANAVLPNTTLGPLIDPTQVGSTAKLVVFDIYNGNTDFATSFPPQYFIDVRDVARLHLVGLVNPDVHNERIFAFAEPFNFHDIFAAVKAAKPDHKLPEDPSSDDRDLSEIAQMPRSIELLKTVGRDRFIPLGQSIIDTLEGS